MNPALPRRWKIAILSGAAIAFLLKILLAFKTFGTNDVYAWERFAHWSAIFGSQLYRIDAAFNHPPSMIHVLAIMTWLAKTTGIGFPFWLRLPAILADAGGLWLVYRIFDARLDEPVVRWGLLLLAISPTLILVSGYHGNTDPVVMFFVLLAVWQRRDWVSGIAFGAAMCVKILPVIALPVLFFSQPGIRRRFVFLGSAVAVMAVCWSPYLFRDPEPIFHQVFGYQSIYGHWGIGWAAYYLTFFRDSWHAALQQYSTWVVLSATTVAAWLINRRTDRPSVYVQVGAAFFLFLATASGFGVQYLAWMTPWTVGLSLGPLVFYTTASGAFLLAVYNYWSGGFPWFLADSNYVGDFTPHLDYFLALAWISVIVLAWTVWKRTPVFPGWRYRVFLLVSALPIVGLPLWRQVMVVDKRIYPAANDRAALTNIHANEQAMLAAQYYRMARYQDAIIAARTGIAIDPYSLDAWNNLALACMKLGRWDEALNAGQNAVRIAPEDETANANLDAATRRY
jgi:tetratricopeptide (TPR) repeat protein